MQCGEDTFLAETMRTETWLRLFFLIRIKALERDVLEVHQAENDAALAEKALNHALSAFKNALYSD